jgi:hypothetical protein
MIKLPASQAVTPHSHNIINSHNCAASNRTVLFFRSAYIVGGKTTMHTDRKNGQKTKLLLTKSCLSRVTLVNRQLKFVLIIFMVPHCHRYFCSKYRRFESGSFTCIDRWIHIVMGYRFAMLNNAQFKQFN